MTPEQILTWMLREQVLVSCSGGHVTLWRFPYPSVTASTFAEAIDHMQRQMSILALAQEEVLLLGQRPHETTREMEEETCPNVPPV